MGTSIVRYSKTESAPASWGVLREGKVFHLDIAGEHHRDVMAVYYNDRPRFGAAVSADPVAADAIHYHAPISRRIRCSPRG